MPTKRPTVKNERQYEALKEKGMSKQRAARIANSPNASSNGGNAQGRVATLSRVEQRPNTRRQVERAAKPLQLSRSFLWRCRSGQNGGGTGSGHFFLSAEQSVPTLTM